MKTKTKKISFLATGTEIITGDIYELNMHDFSKEISAKGGIIYQHLACTDSLDEIKQALNYLLLHSDILIVTGGLGPTSDDRTRFALSEVLDIELVFHDNAWQHIHTLLTQYQIPENPGHRQQALFPANSTLMDNANGSAFGCHFTKNDKLIFMLPGPPRENKPMFYKTVLPVLEKAQAFTVRTTYRWLTLGLVEGAIAAQIDALAQPFAFVDTGFRWSYPYLEIKIISDATEPPHALIAQIEDLLAPYLVSHDNKTAQEILHSLLEENTYSLDICDLLNTNGSFEKELASYETIHCIVDKKKHRKLFFKLHSTPVSDHKIQFHSQGFHDNQLIFEHEMTVLFRPKIIDEFALIYSQWQLGNFIKFIDSAKVSLT